MEGKLNRTGPGTKRALVTGCAGFIGSHLVELLLEEGWEVLGVDNFDPFYEPAIKRRNLERAFDHPRFALVEADIRDGQALDTALTPHMTPQPPPVIVHLAARAGVRPSIEDPEGYYRTNVLGTQNLLELSRKLAITRFVFASSSSVYGVNPRVPWREDDAVLQPVSPYGASKVAGELLGHVYSHLYGIRFIGLRLFTVYGPRQRPDLAIHKFARRILANEPLPLYGDGTTSRDYTYVDDIVRGIRAAMDQKSTYAIVNLGNHHAVPLLEMVNGLEQALGRKATLSFGPPQPGDVPHTWADITNAETHLGWRPRTPFAEGLAQFADWLTRKDASATPPHF